MPLLSIITINFNDREGLQRTINSVKAQTCTDFEWILIDGGSTDGSVELIRENSSMFAFWVSEPDAGIYNAMNKGVTHARGEYLQFLNAGDELFDSMTIQHFAERDNSEDVIYGRAMIIDSAGRELWHWPLPEMPLRLSYFWNHSLKHQASFFSRRCFDAFSYNEAHRINSDTELFMTLLYHGYTFGRYDSYVVRFNGEGLSSKPQAKARMDTEFADTLHRLMPEGMLLDYQDVIQMRDVDLHQMIKTITTKKRWARNLARAVIYPVYYLLKLMK